jgi:hypothetical protein
VQRGSGWVAQEGRVGVHLISISSTLENNISHTGIARYCFATSNHTNCEPATESSNVHVFRDRSYPPATVAPAIAFDGGAVLEVATGCVVGGGALLLAIPHLPAVRDPLNVLGRGAKIELPPRGWRLRPFSFCAANPSQVCIQTRSAQEQSI